MRRYRNCPRRELTVSYLYLDCVMALKINRAGIKVKPIETGISTCILVDLGFLLEEIP